jgi:hypothetical protein
MTGSTDQGHSSMAALKSEIAAASLPWQQQEQQQQQNITDFSTAGWQHAAT